MELRQLRYLVAIAKEQNVSRAAKLCFVSQPALTQQIHKLEEELNISLLVRRGRGIALTSAGERLTKHARQLTRKVDEIKNEFSQLDKNNIHYIKIGVVPELLKLGQDVIDSKPVVKNKRFKIKMIKMTDDQIDYELRRGMINAAITTKVPKLKDAISIPTILEKITLITSKSNELSRVDSVCIKSLLNEPLVMLHESLSSRTYFNNYLESNHIKFKVMIEVSSISELVEVIKNSNFISFSPNGRIVNDFSNDVSSTPLSDNFFRENYLCWGESDNDSDKIKCLEKYFHTTL